MFQALRLLQVANRQNRAPAQGFEPLLLKAIVNSQKPVAGEAGPESTIYLWWSEIPRLYERLISITDQQSTNWVSVVERRLDGMLIFRQEGVPGDWAVDGSARLIRQVDGATVVAELLTGRTYRGPARAPYSSWSATSSTRASNSMPPMRMR
jgi:hypothetical protein